MEQELNKVIDELARINSAAAEFAHNMEDSKSHIMDEHQKEKDDFAGKVREEAENRLALEVAELNRKKDDRIARMHRENEAYMSRLESSYVENHKKWAQEIAGRITGTRL